MGYSHYWFQEHGAIDQATWNRICIDVRKLITACPLRLSEQMGEARPPLISAESIVFNGFGDLDGHEPFKLDRVPNEGFSFCKTLGKCYDTVVCAVLAVAAEDAPSAIRVQSDGTAEDWRAAITWASETLERSISNPIS